MKTKYTYSDGDYIIRQMLEEVPSTITIFSPEGSVLFIRDVKITEPTVPAEPKPAFAVGDWVQIDPNLEYGDIGPLPGQVGCVDYATDHQTSVRFDYMPSSVYGRSGSWMFSRAGTQELTVLPHTSLLRLVERPGG